MLVNFRVFELLAAELTLQGFSLASLFVDSESTLHICKAAVDTRDLLVFVSLVGLFVCLWNAGPAGRALVVLSGTAHLVHAELAHFN